jgi:hypothetical protein
LKGRLWTRLLWLGHAGAWVLGGRAAHAPVRPAGAALPRGVAEVLAMSGMTGERGPWRRPDHDALRAVLRTLPEDYTPYGEDERWADPARAYPDCSCGCRFAAWLEDGGQPSADWLVCTNPASHRAGLLTFEHQGCEHFESEDDGDEA